MKGRPKSEYEAHCFSCGNYVSYTKRATAEKWLMNGHRSCKNIALFVYHELKMRWRKP